MEKLCLADREILREIARRKLEMAQSPENDRILAMWKKQAAGKRDTPTVRLLFSNFPDEVIENRMRCTGETARRIEFDMLWSLVGRELFGDDTPLSPTYDIPLITRVDPYGVKSVITHTRNSKGFHMEPVTDDLEADEEMFLKGYFSIEEKETQELADVANEAFGDILPVRIVMNGLTGPFTNPLVMLIGMENLYMAMYDAPDSFHRIMDSACRVYEGLFDELEKRKLLRSNNDFCCLPQESFGFTDELPHEGVTGTKQMWGFLESQEMTAASPEMYGEFVYPYMDRLVRRFGLLSYGCCERVDNLFENYLSKWKNLRKLSVSPFNDEHKVGDFLRGSNIVYYSKPRAEYVTNPGPLDEDAVRRCFKGICECASGCLFEVAQREVGTIYGDWERGRRYVELARESIDRWWKP